MMGPITLGDVRNPASRHARVAIPGSTMVHGTRARPVHTVLGTCVAAWEGTDICPHIHDYRPLWQCHASPAAVQGWAVGQHSMECDAVTQRFRAQHRDHSTGGGTADCR